MLGDCFTAAPHEISFRVGLTQDVGRFDEVEAEAAVAGMLDEICDPEEDAGDAVRVPATRTVAVGGSTFCRTAHAPPGSKPGAGRQRRGNRWG